MKQDWKRIVLANDATIRNALEVINNETFRMAFVVDDANNLCGSITDGDIRRGLLSGYHLEDCLQAVMNKSPKSVNKKTRKSTIFKLMDTEHINCIPVLEDKKIHSIVTRADLGSFKYDNPVFLMAGGFGKRLRPLTNSCPKPLLKVGGTPILEIILERFVHAGFHKFFISTHYLSDQFRAHFGTGEKWNVEITYINEDQPLGTAGALGFLNDFGVSLPTIVMNGDILTGVNFSELLEYHNSTQGKATLCVSDYEYQIPFGVVSSDGDNAVAIVEKPKHKVAISSGIYVLNPEVIANIEHNKSLDMPNLLRKLMAKGDQVNTFQIYEHWLDIGRKEDFEQAKNQFKADVVAISR